MMLTLGNIRNEKKAQVSHAHPQILHLGETIHLFQPPEVPGGSWEEMEAITWAVEQNPDGQVKLTCLFLGRFMQRAQKV